MNSYKPNTMKYTHPTLEVIFQRALEEAFQAGEKSQHPISYKQGQKDMLEICRVQGVPKEPNTLSK